MEHPPPSSSSRTTFYSLSGNPIPVLPHTQEVLPTFSALLALGAATELPQNVKLDGALGVEGFLVCADYFGPRDDGPVLELALQYNDGSAFVWDESFSEEDILNYWRSDE